jgi:trehalose 6-phosphate synthase/phosphatase
MDEWFASVPKLGLCAERGFHYKLPSVTGAAWRCSSDMHESTTSSWQSYSYQLMRQFVKRTQGAYIENKGSALVWQYRDADQHYGSWQAKELSSHLKELLFGFEVEVVEGKGYVEVKLRNINKGVAAAKVLESVANVFGKADFVLCCGDDRSDEDMFETVNQLLSESRDPELDEASTTDTQHESDGSTGDAPEKVSSLGMKTKMKAVKTVPTLTTGSCMNLAGLADDADEPDVQNKFYTVVVGQKPSEAQYFVDDVDEMSELLKSLARAGENRRMKMLRNSSDLNQTSAYTWSSGGGMGKKLGSMPALSSVGFAAPKMRRAN